MQLDLLYHENPVGTIEDATFYLATLPGLIFHPVAAELVEFLDKKHEEVCFTIRRRWVAATGEALKWLMSQPLSEDLALDVASFLSRSPSVEFSMKASYFLDDVFTAALSVSNRQKEKAE